MLAPPDFTQRFYIQCNASSFGVGGVLFQKSVDGEEHPICYFSKKLNGAQRNYSVTEQECLAALLSIQKFRAYVEGMPFTVITDHSSLRWLMDQKDLSGRLARWSLKLQSFSFSIEYRKGSDNIVPDALSRAFCDEVNGMASTDSSEKVFTPPNIPLDSPAFLTEAYRAEIQKLKEMPKLSSNIVEHEGKIYINSSPEPSYVDTDIPNYKLVVPSELTIPLIKQAHDSPHALILVYRRR